MEKSVSKGYWEIQR